MKKKLVITLSLLIMATIFTVPIIGKAMENNNNKRKEESVSEQQAEVDEIKEEISNIDDKNLPQQMADEKEKELYAELNEKEVEYGLYDYKEEIYSRLSTVDTSVKEMKRMLENGKVPDNEIENIKTRIKIFTPFVKKYNKIIKKSEKEVDYDYEALSNKFDDELEKLYEEAYEKTK